MATILKGAPVVAAMNERNAALCEQLKAKGITPTLAVVRVPSLPAGICVCQSICSACITFWKTWLFATGPSSRYSIFGRPWRDISG